MESQSNGVKSSDEATQPVQSQSTQAQTQQLQQQQQQQQQQTSSQSTHHASQQSLAQQQLHKPRDVRLIHSLLASQGVSAYQDRVPLMLLDFAYRYTRSVLSDAQQLAWEGYGTQGNTNQNSGRAADAPTDVSLQALRLAVQGRQVVLGATSGIAGAGKQKSDLMELSAETNRVGLPRVEREFGVRLPGEKYLLAGPGFGLKEEWVELDQEEHDEQEDGMDVDEGGDVLMLDNEKDGDALFGSEDGDDAEFEEVMGVNADRKMADA
jgi:transcription initiation factor TFIID subunit 9B